MATTFPNLYGASAGADNLTSESNAQVAAFFLSQDALPGSKVEAEVLATELNVYQLLLAVNQQAVNGALYNGNAQLRRLANDLFSALN